MKILIIGFGGAIGAILRYIVSGLDYRISNGIFPIGTLVVNISGAFIVGLLWAFFENFSIMPAARAFIFIGILGGYTTFSAFALENFYMFRNGAGNIALLNIVLSNVLGVLFVFLGYNLIRVMIKS